MIWIRERGVVLGTFEVTAAGDWEGLPRRSELDLLDHHDDIVR